MLVTAAVFAVFAQSALAARRQLLVRRRHAEAAVDSALQRSNARASTGAFCRDRLPSTSARSAARTPQAGDVYLDGSLLDSGRFSWGVVQHEFAHQVDFMLFDDSKRALLGSALGGKDWCYSIAGLAHSDYGCERFASELAWAYWPSADNSMAPAFTHGESGGMPVTQFRALVAQLLGIPSLARLTPVKAFAPNADRTAEEAPLVAIR